MIPKPLRWSLIILLLVLGFIVILQNLLNEIHFLNGTKKLQETRDIQTLWGHNNVPVKMIGLSGIKEEELYIAAVDLADSREFKNFDDPDELKQQVVTRALTPAALTLAQRLKVLLNCNDRELEMEKQQYGEYWLVRNFIRGSISKSVGCAETITYTTNGDYTFFGSLAMVVARWLAPVSLAVFAPGHDLNATMDSIQYVRNCLPESELIRQYVTFHIYFPNNHMPTYLPRNEEEALRWQYDCSRTAIPYENVEPMEMYKTKNNLTYPINVGRNIARKEANTYFIFACDIELFPSPGLVQQFLEMVDRNQSTVLGGINPRVYVLAVFELDKNATLPENKIELEKMLHTKMAIPFHAKICKNCHLIPKHNEWVNAAAHSKELSVFSMTKREKKFKVWEPFYISDNKEPMFDERVTWEGQKNKRIQGYAMCLMDYEYHVLNSAFLVHSPGIKYFIKNSTRSKYFVPKMNYFITHTIEPEYRILYGKNKNCAT